MSKVDTFAIRFNAQRYLIKIYEKQFREIFNIRLQSCYGNALEIAMFGFDVVKFNDLMRVPDNVSLNDFIKGYGNEAVTIIEMLCKDYDELELIQLSSLFK